MPFRGLTLSLPPRVPVAQALRRIATVARERMRARSQRNRLTYASPAEVGGPLARHLAALPRDVLAGVSPALRLLVPRYREHRFDLLGSGWVRVAHGETYPGFGRWRYGPGPQLGGDWRNDLSRRLPPGNRERSEAILRLIDDADYLPIDWHVDFRSGYRWSEATWGRAILYGHRPGVDVKVPWELARLQHLPQLALAYALDRDPALAGEFRNQVLDFLGANPPGWGVNWACAMDVAIRAANLVLAFDLFRAHGAVFDRAFEEELGAATLSHGRYVTDHLEWHAQHRGNHYLADVCGLCFIAAYLPRAPQADAWLAFALQELEAEVMRQFGGDGGGFEASTAYHRLGAEMAIAATALALGLSDDTRAGLAACDASLWRREPPLSPPRAHGPVFPAALFERLARAAAFAADVTKPSGEIVQIGDNDSGCFFKLSPSPDEDGRKRLLDATGVVAAAKGILDLELPTRADAAVDTAVVAGLAKGRRGPRVETTPLPVAQRPLPATPATRCKRVLIVPPDGTALADLETVAYPEFGLFLWRNARTFLSVRCGPGSRDVTGAHAHNDQLAVELEIDGVPWIRDPGTFVYTADLKARNAYRSAAAHFVPRQGDREPAALLAPFRLDDRAKAEVLRFEAREFLGVHHGFGAPVYRRVLVQAAAIVIEDSFAGLAPAAETSSEVTVRSPGEIAALSEQTPPFSPGYGLPRPDRT